MTTIKQHVSNKLHWHVKWVRGMLIISVIAVLTILFIPSARKKKIISFQRMEADTVLMYAAPAPVDSVSGSVVVRRELTRPEMAYPKVKERQSMTVEEKKPFDWKGTITWAIGAMNGFVLIILNIKNLIIKKKP